MHVKNLVTELEIIMLIFSGKLKLQTRSDILFPSKDLVHRFMKRGFGGLAGGMQSHMAFAIQSYSFYRKISRI